jgi:peptidoglycan hydrolase CwlO-like protein
MSTSPAVSRKDIDDVLGALDIMMTRIEDRFDNSEDNVAKIQAQIGSIQNQLDSIEKQLEISEDERLIMAHQLTQLHEWVERAAKRIDVKNLLTNRFASNRVQMSKLTFFSFVPEELTNFFDI